MAYIRQPTKTDSVDSEQTLAEGVLLLHGGRQVATAEGRIVGPDMKLYAHATTTCLILDRRKSAA